MEALIGAMYLDAEKDLAPAQAFIETYIFAEEQLDKAAKDVLSFDSKSKLQEQAAARGLSVRYELQGESGPAHEKAFQSAVFVGDECLGIGEGRSKKASEQAAATQALEKL